MEREQVDREVQDFFTLIPSPAKSLTAAQKIRELIGIALSALSSCPHCAFYHSQLARVHGATEGEIEDAFREPEKYLEKKIVTPLMD